MPNWRELKHAYGSAEDIPEIISALTPDSTSPAWEDLRSRVCHQGTTYSASPAVLPFLLGFASNWNATDRAMPLSLAASIVAAPQTILNGYEETVEGLRTLALGTLNNLGLSREDRIYLFNGKASHTCFEAVPSHAPLIREPFTVDLFELSKASWDSKEARV
jgi:hypothetical protein